jgi:glycosyltransferase involved in cell wall biosynthesis
MKILICPASLHFSDTHPAGETQIAYGFARALARRGHRVTVFSPRVTLGTQVDGLRARALAPCFGQLPGGGSYSREKLLWWEFSLRALREARRLQAAEGIDVIHHLMPAHRGKWSLLGRLRVPLVYGPVPCTWGEEGAEDVTPPRGRRFAGAVAAKIMDRCDMHIGLRLWRWTVSSSRIVIASTEAAREALDPAQAGRSFSLPFGVDTNVFHPNGHGAGAPPAILYLGLLARRKGIFDLLHAFSMMRADIGARLIVIGGGEVEQVKRRATDLGIRQRVDVLGEIPHDQVAEHMRSCTLFCLPSHGEPFGMVLLQAMASGKAVVATRGGGVGSVIVEGESGVLVGQKHPAELARALEHLLLDENARKRMGSFNRARAEREFDWEVVTEKLVSIYERAIGA